MQEAIAQCVQCVKVEFCLDNIPLTNRRTQHLQYVHTDVACHSMDQSTHRLELTQVVMQDGSDGNNNTSSVTQLTLTYSMTT